MRKKLTHCSDTVSRGGYFGGFFFLHFLVCTLVFLENEYCTGGESRVITGFLEREALIQKKFLNR